MKSQAKILVLDVETMATLAYVWGLRDVNIPLDMIVQDEYMLCYCAQWFGEKKVMSDSILDYPKEFKKDKTSDRMIAESLHKLLDQADIVVTYNGDKFDLKWANTLFLKHGLGPVSPFKSIDVLKESRKNFRAISYKLQYSLMKYKIGEKLKHEGWPMWIKFASGNKNTKMIPYCKEDVRNTTEYYQLIRPFIQNHPNLSLYEPPKDKSSCPKCGCVKVSEVSTMPKYKQVYEAFKCYKCGGWWQGQRVHTKRKKKKHGT